MEKKIVHFLSAADRINYGDLLFPILFKKVVKKYGLNIDFKNYGIVKSNLKYFGALETNSYRCFIRNVRKEGGNIIIGGGDVLFPSWSTLYAFINPVYSFFITSYKIRSLEKTMNIAKKILSNGSVMLPFSPSINELNSRKKVAIFYNAVGGFYSIKNKIKKNILTSNYISVRNNVTKDNLMKEGIDSFLSPDSALIMSDFYSNEMLKNKITFDFNLIKEDYMVLQLGANKSPSNVVAFIKELEAQAEILNCRVILCPIGQAPNHMDQVILKKVEDISRDFKLIIPNNIYDVMFLISNSKLYIGTSLHGMITSQSFGIPFVPLNEKISKMDSYCKTWFDEELSIRCLEFTKISNLSGKVKSWNFKKLHDLTTLQKKLIYLNYDEIFKKLI